MAKSEFDFSLLKPINENNSNFESQLKPIEEEDVGSYLDNLPEPEGFLTKLPRNILIGLTHAGRNLHNLPHDLMQLGENAAQSLGQSIGNFKLPQEIQEKINLPQHRKLSEYLPYDEKSYADVYGQKDEGTLMDRLIQKGFEHAPEIVGGIGALRAGLRRYPITRRGASRQLREAEEMINQRGINNFTLNNELLQESIPFLPRTHATRNMLEEIRNGGYVPAFSLQSQIGHHARNLAQSPLAAERLLAPQARELKQLILHEMEQALRGTGHHEEADLLRGGINDYRRYIRFRERALPILKKIGIPTTGLALLGLGITKGKKIANNATKLLE